MNQMPTSRIEINWRAEAKGGASWLPGAENPSYLDGSYVGDFGWDPLGLGKDPQALAWYRQAELQHARWAMLGTVGILVPRLLSDAGLQWPGAGVSWLEAPLFEYYSDDKTLFVIEVLAMGWVETKRYFDWKNPGSQGLEAAIPWKRMEVNNEPGYPGGVFDFAGWSKGGKGSSFEELKLKEIKNGRLAMLSILGFFGQQAVTGMDPIDAWKAHLASPYENFIWANELVACSNGSGLCSRGGEAPELAAALDVFAGIGGS